jgi:hypothetical protein
VGETLFVPRPVGGARTTFRLTIQVLRPIDLTPNLWHPRFMMQATEESTGVTYGALIGFAISIVATLAVTGGAGYYLARSVNDTDTGASMTVTTSTVPATFFDLHGSPADETVQQAETNPFVK